MRAYNSETKARLKQILESRNQTRKAQLESSVTDLRARRAGATKDVIIIGAGAAGLCCAYELEKQGFNVKILEAQKDHIGGRIRTFRNGDNYGELGAMRIPTTHDLTLGYINEFGLTTRSFVQENEKTFGFIRGEKINRKSSDYELLKKKFTNMDPSEQALSADDIWIKSVVATLESLSDTEEEELYGPKVSSGYLKRVDQKSLYNELRSKNFSRDAIEFVCAIYGVTTYLDTGLTEHLREEHDGVWLGDFLEIEGGMDNLIKGFKDKIQAGIKQGAVVYEIINDDNKPIVKYKFDNNEEEISADWVICTIPLGVLSRVDLGNAFSHEKINAIRNVHYDSSSKILCETKNRFWEIEDGIYGGGSIWDEGLGHTWYPSDNTSEDPEVSIKPSMLLASYTWGQHARRIDSIPDSQLKGYVVNELRKIHPYIKDDDIISCKRWSWDNHEWSSGAFAFFNAGDHTDMYNHLVRPEKRVLLAGEHCSLTHSWIQGSLESAHHVCHHIFNS